MSARKKTSPTQSQGSIATNLTLSSDARDMAAQLKRAMFRPSISNVVEALIQQKAAELGLLKDKKSA